MIRKTDTVYISGPMTGQPFFNYFKFYAWAGMIAKEYGCDVLNPARHRDGMPYQFYMDCAAADLQHATVIVLLDGWQESRGANLELDMASKRGGIRVIRETDLLMDLDKRFSLRNPPPPLVVNTRKPIEESLACLNAPTTPRAGAGDQNRLHPETERNAE